MKLPAFSLGLLVAGGPWSAHAQTSPATTRLGQAQGVSRATAAALARVVAPMELMVPAEVGQSRKVILALPTLDETARELEAEFPGIYAALWAEIEPAMRRHLEAGLPSYWTALEQLYVSRLTENEAQAVMRFFQSPTGQKLIRTMYVNVDATPMFADMTKNDNYSVDEKQMKAMTDAAKAKAVKEVGPEDEGDLWILMASIKLDKFQALGAETQKLTLDWVNNEDAEGDAELGKLMEETMKRYMAAHPPRQ